MPKFPSSGPRSGARLRAGGIPLRPGKDKGQLEVLLVSRRRVPDSFTVPAGKFERDADRGSFSVCALRETREEAGVECEIVFDLGWHKSLTKDKLVTQTRFYAMRCVGEMGDWMEQAERRREWRTVEEAAGLVAHNAMLAQVFQTLNAALIDRCNTEDPLAPDRADWASSGGTSDDSDGMQDLLWLPEAEELQSGKDGDPSSPPPEVPSSPAEARHSSADDLAPFVRSVSNHSSFGGAGIGRLRSSSAAERVTLQNAEGERFQFYGHQVGGHFCFVKPAPEILRITVEPPSTAAPQAPLEIPAQNVVLKPFEEREYKFYLDVIEGAPALLPHMAKVFGTKHLTHRQVEAMVIEVDSLVQQGCTPLESRMRSHEFQKYICMEDLACSMAEPCILDLKMGFKQRSKRHASAKRERCRKKALSSTSHRLGFRVCGIHTLGKHQDKYWGRKASCEALHEACRSFFLPARANEAQRAGLLSHLLGNVRDLREAVALLPHWRFWSTSLLFLYDGADPDRPPVMRMIDFPHCTRVREQSSDAEYIAGLQNLETFLSAVLGGHPYAPWVCEQLVPPPPEERQDADEREDDEDAKGST